MEHDTYLMLINIMQRLDSIESKVDKIMEIAEAEENGRGKKGK